MTYPENVVSLHPYLKVHPGKMAEFKALMPAFIARTAKEPANLYYEFTLNGDEAFCREAYVGAAGLKAHMANVGDLITEQMKLATIFRLEFHGPAAELDLLRADFAGMKPAWFIKEAGLKK
jgi:quinol monooxygenase YgiN